MRSAGWQRPTWLIVALGGRRRCRFFRAGLLVRRRRAGKGRQARDTAQRRRRGATHDPPCRSSVDNLCQHVAGRLRANIGQRRCRVALRRRLLPALRRPLRGGLHRLSARPAIGRVIPWRMLDSSSLPSTSANFRTILRFESRASKAQHFQGFQREPVCWPPREFSQIALRTADILQTCVLCRLAHRFSAPTISRA
jgi:hypothetical protein